jgi:glycerol-3-phosphate dehydrogenase
MLVVGLGVTGAGVALDASARGLDVVAIDAQDLAFGTSRWSSKLVHGGLRYLANGQLGLAHESAVERGILMQHTAPHLVRALPFVLPVTRHVSTGQATRAAAAFRVADALRVSARTPRSILPRPRRLSAVETLALADGIGHQSLRGGLLGWDGQLSDDVALVVGLARTAAGRGARMLTRVRALALTGEGATVRDELTGETATVRARAVVNATGVWAGDLVPDVHLRPSRGSHLVLAPETLPGWRAAVAVPVAGERNRYVFALPQSDGRVYVGLTDEPVDGPVPDVPVPTPGELGALLAAINSVLEQPLAHTQVAGAFAGVRPLLEADGRTADLSRRHAVLVSETGVVTVVGGKLTTYRQMAEDAVDVAVRRAGRVAGPCLTRRLPLVGAADRRTLCSVDAPRRMVARYGVEAGRVQALPGARRVVCPGLPYTAAELAFGVSHEGALDVSDLLERRTRIGLVAADLEPSREVAEEALARVA